MSLDIKVPAFGESITSANVARWHKPDGSAVRKGETLVTFETDKVSSELESPADGVLTIIVPEGTEVSIGAVIASVAEGTAAAPASAPVAAPAAAAPAPAPVAAVAAPAPATAPVAAPIAAPTPTLIVATPTPIVETATPAVNDGRTTRKKMSMLRRKIANHLVNAQQTAAILTTFNEVDMTAVMSLRKSVQDDFLKKYQVKLGFMSFFIKAVVQALKDVPQINAMVDGTDIIENHFYDIGVAIGTEKGLIVPVLKDCDQKNFARIEQDILDFAAKAREGKIAMEDLQGGVFTISNGGVYGSSNSALSQSMAKWKSVR